MKKIVIFAPTPAPYRAYEYDLVQSALKEKYEFQVLFMERSWGDMKWRDDLPRSMKWEVLPRARISPYVKRVPGFRRVNSQVLKRLRDINPDAIILQGYDAPALWTAYCWATWHNRPILFRSDSNILKDLNRPHKRVWLGMKRLLLRQFFSRVSAFITIGSGNEDYYAYYGGKPTGFFRASYMVDFDKFSSLADREREGGKPLKQELGIRQDKVLLFVGRLVWEKDLENVLKAFIQALPELGDTAFLLVGDGPKKALLQEISLPVKDHVYWAGFRQPDELGRIYGIADAFVLGSVQEAWGLVVNEAMAASVPVISSDKVAAGNDLVIPGVTGELFPARDVPSLAECLKKVLADKQTAARMGKNGRQYLREWNKKYDVATSYRDALDYAFQQASR